MAGTCYIKMVLRAFCPAMTLTLLVTTGLDPVVHAEVRVIKTVGQALAAAPHGWPP